MMLGLLVFGIATVLGREMFELTLENYADIKRSHRPLLVLFHNDDRQNLRFFEEFKTIANDDDVLDAAITLGYVDAAAEEELVKKTQVTTFPTCYLFVEGD
jgi:thioredoxin-like negative regulator of GroEL